MSEDSVVTSKSLATEEFDTLKGVTPPKFALIREMDFKIEEENLKIYISRAWGPIEISPGGIEETLGNWLDQSNLPKSNRTIYSQPYQSRLSINNRSDYYIVYILTNKNWQFTQDGAPFRISAEGKNSKCYYEAKRLVKNKLKYDSQYQGTKPTNGLPRDWCRCAYFVAFGANRMQLNPSGYVDNINIYIDLFDDNDGSNTPLIIDPDIRYPGGNTIVEDGGGAITPV